MTPEDPPIAELFEVLEQEAYDRSRRLEAGGRLPYGWTEHHYPSTTEERLENERVRACWMLAKPGDLDTLRALLRGEAVPRSRLNQDYLWLLERWEAA